MEPVKIKLGNAFSKLEGHLPPQVWEEVDHRTSFQIPGYFFSKLYKSGRWDGRKHLLWKTSQFFPTGLAGYVCDALQYQKYPYQVEDCRKKPIFTLHPLSLRGIRLRDYQIEAINAGIKAERGILDLAGGSGKTSLGSGIIQVLGLPSLVVTHRTELLYQTGTQIQNQTGIIVGYIGDGNWRPEKVTVAMIETLATSEKKLLKELLDSIDILIIDEGHLLAAKVFYSIIQKCNAYFRYVLCISGRTKILMADGRELAIAYLQRWHERWSEKAINVKTFNFERGIIEDRVATVVRVPANGKKCLDLTFKCGPIIRTLRCSEDHKVFCASKNKFLRASELEINDEVKLVFRTCKECGKVLSLKQSTNSHCSHKCSSAPVGKKRAALIKSWKTNDPLKYKEFCNKCRNHMLKYYKTLKGKSYAQKTSLRMRSGKAKSMADKSNRLNARWGHVTKEEKQKQVAPMIKAGEPFRSYSPQKRGLVRITAKDGHLCHSSYEVVVDDWLFEHHLIHKVHPRVPNSNSWADFKVGDFFIEVDGMHRPPNYKKSLYSDRNLKVIFIKYNISKTFKKVVNHRLLPLLNGIQDPVGVLVKKQRATQDYAPNYLYDLQVQGNNNFFANGVLVHNSATPLMRDDNRNLMVIGATGPTIFKVSAARLIKEKVLAEPKVEFLRVDSGLPITGESYQEIYDQGITNNKLRNSLILKKVREHKGNQVLVLVRIIKHGRNLQTLFTKEGVKSEFIWGDDKADHRRNSLDDFKRRKLKVLISSVILKEGVDIPAIDVLIVASGAKSKITTLQSLGRALRRTKRKTKALIIDFTDLNNQYLLRHSKRRLKIYQKEQFKISISP